MKLKESLYWLFFLSLCLGAGYLHGSLPQYYVTQKIIRDPLITLAVNERQWITETFQVILEEALDQKVEVTVIENKEDLFSQISKIDYGILPIEWTKELFEKNKLKAIQPSSQISTDFILNNYDNPLFWSFRDEKLFVFSFVAFDNGNNRNAQKDLNKILKKQTYEILLKETNISGTLERLEKQGIRPELKPSHLRTRSLLKTQPIHSQD